MTEGRIIAEGLGFVEGPVWTQDGRLLVTSISESVIYELGDGDPRVLVKTGGGPNGMTGDADGTLYVTQNSGIYGTGERSADQATPGVQRIAGSDVSYLATEGLDAPNDLCFGPDGRLYFTDPRGPANGTNTDPGRVYAMALDGAPELLAEGPRFTNGLAFGADATQLYVAETFGRRVLLYEVADGRLGEPREFCDTKPGFPDGMCFDQAGRLYVAATLALAVLVFDSDGNRVEELPCGEGSLPTNAVLGGPNGTTLYVTDSGNGRVLAFERDSAALPLYPFR